jgi:hypothetical protein
MLSIPMGMSEKAAKRYEEARNKGDARIDESQPPAEPIYDLTTGDENELVKAGTPRERGDKP